MSTPDYRVLLKNSLLKIEALEARLARQEAAKAEPIAIVGMACRFPGEARAPDALWRMLRDGVDAVRKIPAERWPADAIPGENPAVRWAGLLDDMGEPLRDPKTALQEWAQARALPLPAYRLVEAAGPDHAPSFRVEVTVGEAPPALGEGRSKRTAEQTAAARLLTLLGERRDG